MKKRWLSLLVCVLAFTVSACGNTAFSQQPPAASEVLGITPTVNKGVTLALLMTEEQKKSDSCAQALAAITLFSGETGLSSGQYVTAPEDAYSTLELAIKGGAQAVVLVGEELEQISLRGQRNYPDVYFILISSIQELPVQGNSVQILPAHEQAGWMAGYACVSDGKTMLAYIDGQTQDDQRYAFGFVLGAEAAAKDIGLQKESVRVLPIGTGTAIEDTEVWYDLIRTAYNQGAQVVLANVPSLQNIVLRAAIKESGWMADFSTKEQDSTRSHILFTVEQKVYNSVYETLSLWNTKHFPAGLQLRAGIKNGDVALSFEHNNTERFTSYAYRTILRHFETGELAQQLALQSSPDSQNNPVSPTFLTLEYVLLYYPS